MIFARILFLLCLFITGCTAQNFKEPASIGQEHKYAPPQPESWKLDNGLTVMFLPDHELPLVSGFLFIKGGSLWESHHEKGVVSALGAQLRSGGAGNLDPLELDEKLSGLAAQVSSGFGAEFGNITFSSMASDLDQVFSIFSDVVLRPRFDNGRLDLWRKQVIDSIERRRDDPGTVARIAFDRITYGNTPYGWSLESRDVKKIDRASLKRMYEKLIYPDQAILGITGDLSKAAAKQLINKHFRDWKPRGRNFSPAPPLVDKPSPGIYFVELPFTQSSVLMGHLGVPRLTPDYIQIKVFNEIFSNSGFGSYLTRRIRAELGLTYGIWGGITEGLVKGQNLIYLQTKGPSTGSAVVESLNVLKQLQEQLITPDELKDTKIGMENAFVFKFDQPAEVLERTALLNFYSYPEDYDATFLDKVWDVSQEEVREVAQKRWRISDFSIVVVGDRTAYNSLTAVLREYPDLLPGQEITMLKFNEVAEFFK